MKESLPHLHQLLRHLQHVPYLASKNIFRVAEHFMRMDHEKREQFIRALTAACTMTVPCGTCGAWKEVARGCAWCDNHMRNRSLVCVVETWHDLCAIERAGGYSGVYHVLGGVICPLEGVGPEHLSIDALYARAAGESVKEVVLALSQTIEGEVTATYIAKRLAPLRGSIIVSAISKGMPVGASLEMTDRITVSKAIAERRPL